MRLLTRVHEMRGEIDTADRELAGMRDEAAARSNLPVILAAPDVRLIRLGPPRGGAGNGFVAMSRKVASAVVEVSDLPPLAARQNYTLWWTFGRRAPVKAAQFRTAADGRAAAAAKLPQFDGEITAVLVTVEASDAAAVPAGAVKLKGPVAKPLVKSPPKPK